MISLLDIDIEKLKNISKITLDNLRNPEVFNRIKELVEEIDIYYFIKEANYLLADLVKLLDKYKELAQSEPRLFKDYQRLVVYLKFLALLSQPINEIEGLFKKHLLIAIVKKIDLKESLRLLFLVLRDEDTGDKARRSIIKAIEMNEEKIGKDNFTGGADRLPAHPYVKNWLRDYNAFFSTGQATRGELEQATYLSQNKNVQKLNQAEREILTGVIQLYDYLRFPEEEKKVVKATGRVRATIPSPPKTEEKNRANNISAPFATTKIVKPETEAASRETLAVEDLEQLAAAYPPGSFERKVIEEEIERMSAGKPEK